MSASMNCPRCGSLRFELITEEVDIEVGVQSFVVGGCCFDCGDIPCCQHCGGWDQSHAAWCNEVKSLQGLEDA